MSLAGKLSALRLPPLRLKSIERLIDMLTDPARRERTVFIVLAVYAAIWTLYGIIAKSSQDVQFDAAELEVVSRDLEFGYAKHPPFAPWLMHGWFSLFPVRDWSYYLLAMTYVALGLWIAWRLFARFLDPVSYIASQRLAQTLLERGSLGVVNGLRVDLGVVGTQRGGEEGHGLVAA